jgi:hypothetical protein
LQRQLAGRAARRFGVLRGLTFDNDVIEPRPW